MNARPALIGISLSPSNRVIPKLEGVRKAGKGYVAICPHCGGKRPKLSILEGDDGRLLLHCWGGCNVHDILGAIGLTVSDLFVRRDLRTLSPAERSQMRQDALIPRWRAALEVVTHEATVLLIAAGKMGDGDLLDDDELKRMRLSATKILDCSEVLNAR